MEELILAPETLDFTKEKVQPITLEQLQKTYDENDRFGNPLRGIYHHELINNVIDKCQQRGLSCEVFDLFAAQNTDKYLPGVSIIPQIEEMKGKNAIEAHILRRLFANIRITNFDAMIDGQLHTTNLAISYTQRGVQIGFGNMVHVCHNQCMLGADQLIQSYTIGDRKALPINKMLETVDEWLDRSEYLVTKEREDIIAMKELKVNSSDILRFIGALTQMRIRHDTSNKAIKRPEDYPMNQSQISQFTEDVTVMMYTRPSISAYDIYNAGTNLFKAQKMDIANILPQNRRLIEAMQEESIFA